jgi:protein involved in polysaccharide export with SLBB domain
MLYSKTLLCSTLCIGLLSSACTPLKVASVRDSRPAGHILDATQRLGPLREEPGAPIPALLPGKSAEDASAERWASNPPLSPGDRLQVDIEDGETFSGRYEVDLDGTLKLPYLPPLSVAGHDVEKAQRRVAQALVEAEYFRAHRVRVSIRVHEWAHVQVHVSGAVFNPGMVTANARNPEERALKVQLSSGDSPSERMLGAALRAAGGVRPDAALDRIELIRDGRIRLVNYRGLLQGKPIVPVPLMSGDRIRVPGSGRFDRDLLAPSAITPPGIRVFLSNLSVPATGNAASAIGKNATSLPYGSRLLTAGVSANCVGGTQTTNAGRYLVLVRTDPLRGQEEVIERKIQDLLKMPQRDDLNPFLMPNDSVACYDSGVTNLRDIARTLGDLLLPLSLL